MALWGKCALNIGLHLTFLPTLSGELPDIETVKEIDCEFRHRVTPDNKTDFWWEYGGSDQSAHRSAQHLIATYFGVAEPWFQSFATIESFVHMYPVDFLELPNGRYHGDTSFGDFPATASRMALAMARIHEHLGDLKLAKEFATKGLANVGQGTSLIPQFQKIINSS